jgi:hypothetical protein
MITGTVSRGDLKLHLQAGKAFVDFSSENSLTPYIGSKITITSVSDPSQKCVGYIKAAGTGETYTDLIGGSNQNYINGDFESGDTTWTKTLSGWAISGGKAVGTAVGASLLYQTVLPAPRGGRLYRLVYDLTTTSGRFTADLGFIREVYNTTSGTFTRYTCQPTTGGNSDMVFTSTADTFTWTGTLDNVTLQEVLTPSATGVTIVSTQGGTTRNWESTTFSTKTIDSSGYTYEIDNGNYSQILAGNNNTLAYGLVNGGGSAGIKGLLISGSGNTIRNYVIANCDESSFEFWENGTVVNSIAKGIVIATGKTVTAKNCIFSDAAPSGTGTFVDGGDNQWGVDLSTVFVDYSGGNYRLRDGSTAIDAGTRN